MPLGFDQPDNATRLQRLGVAQWVKPSDFSGQRVAEALQTLLSDQRTAEQCRLWADRIRTEDAVGDTCNLLERLAK
jgi:UDP:flavonoid glycosyltransferase YjiC (YdhE family)